MKTLEFSQIPRGFPSLSFRFGVQCKNENSEMENLGVLSKCVEAGFILIKRTLINVSLFRARSSSYTVEYKISLFG